MNCPGCEAKATTASHRRTDYACGAYVIDGTYHVTIACLENQLVIKDYHVERLNRMLRASGAGQGQIDAYVAQCERVEKLEAWITRQWQARCDRYHDDPRNSGHPLPRNPLETI